MNYIKNHIKLIWKRIGFSLIYFVVSNCFGYIDKDNNNIIFECPDELSIFYNKSLLDIKNPITAQTKFNHNYSVILGEFSKENITDNTHLNTQDKYDKTKYIYTTLHADNKSTLQYFAPFYFSSSRKKNNNKSELDSITIKSKPILLNEDRIHDLGCVIFGNPLANNKPFNSNKTRIKMPIYIEQGIIVQESISCNNNNTIQQCINSFNHNINYKHNNNFKAYAGLMFYQPVYTDITINKNGKISGEYGIANSTQLIFANNTTNLLNTKLVGTLDNQGEIIGNKAAIDISCDVLADKDKENSKFTINNKGTIKGSIILSTNQNGKIYNSGTIEKNNNNPMIINPGGISQLDNYGIIRANTLDMSDISSYNKNFKLVNRANAKIDIDTLKITNLINENKAKITTKTLTILRDECVNRGEIHAKEIFAEPFNNYAEVFSDSIDGEFVNNKSATLHNCTTYDNLVITADFTNHGIIKTDYNLNIDKYLLNHATCTANVMRIDGLVNNFKYIEINESIRVVDGLLFNQPDSILKLNADINHLNGKYFNFSNKGWLIVSHNLILTSDFINESNCKINHLNCEIRESGQAEFINKKRAEIEFLENAIIKNNKDAVLYIKNAIGISYIDNYSNIDELTIDKNAILTIDNLDILKSEKVINNGKLVIVKQAEIKGNLLDNQGILDLQCKQLKLTQELHNSGTISINQLDQNSVVKLFNKVKANVIFNQKIDNKNIDITNEGIVEFSMPATIKSYVGNGNDLLILNCTQTVLVAGEVSFTSSSNILLKTLEEAKEKLAYSVNLIHAKQISIENTETFKQNMRVCFSENQLPVPNKFIQPILIVNKIEIDNPIFNKQNLKLNLQWVPIFSALFPKIDNGAYLNKDAQDMLNGVINNNITIEGNQQNKWYIADTTLCIGKKNKTSNVIDSTQALTIRLSKNHVPVGTINIINKINVANANAVSLKKPNEIIKSDVAHDDCALYLIKGMFIEKDAELISTSTNFAGLDIDIPIEGTITNYGIIQGERYGININAPLNLINGAIVNYGTIEAKDAIKTNSSAFYKPSRYKKTCKIINHNKIIGGLDLNGADCSLINAKDIRATKIEVDQLYNQTTGTIHVDNLNIRNKISNYGEITITTIIKTSSFFNALNAKVVFNNIKSQVTKFFNNKGTVIANILANDKGFINDGVIYAEQILINHPLILGSTATIYTNLVNSDKQNIEIYGGGKLILGDNSVQVELNKNLTLFNDTKIFLNANVIQESTQLIANSISILPQNKFLSYSYSYTINPSSTLNCREQIQHFGLHLINHGTLNIPVGSRAGTYEGKENSLLELKIDDKAKLNNLARGSLFVLKGTATFDNNSKIIIKLEDMLYAIKPSITKSINILASQKVIYNNATITNTNVNNLLVTKDYYGMELSLTNLVVAAANKYTISARLTIEDNTKTLGANMQRAQLVLSADLLTQLATNNNFVAASMTAVAWSYNKPDSSSAYTNNLVIYPRILARNTKRVNHSVANGLNINFNRITTIYSEADKPVFIIGTEVSASNYFTSASANTVNIQQININNVVLDGGHENTITLQQNGYKSKIILADNHGLVITGTNDLIVGHGIHIDNNTKLFAGSSANALHLDCNITADIINQGIIGDKNTGCALYIRQPMSGTITNNNYITAKNTAITIDPLTPWKNNQELTIENSGIIDGNITLLNSKNIKYKVSLINQGIIKNSAITYVASVDLCIDNQATGNIKINHALVVNANNFTNKGVIKAKSLEITGNLTIGGTVIIDNLVGNNHQLTVNNLIVNEIKDINLTVTNLQGISTCTGDVVLNNNLEITNDLNQQANLIVHELKVNGEAKLTNSGSIKVLSGVIYLNNKNYANNESIEINGDLTLTADFNTNGNLTANNLHLNNHQLSVAKNKIIIVNNNIFTKSNKILVLKANSKLKLGNNTNAVNIEGNFYLHNQDEDLSKIDKYNSTVELNAPEVKLQGILKVGNIQELKQSTFNVAENSELLLSDIIAANNLNLVNKANVELRAGSSLKNYEGYPKSQLVLVLDINKLTAKPVLELTEKAIFNIESTIKIKPLFRSTDNRYTAVTLIKTANNGLLNYINNTEIPLTEENAARLISHKIINSYLIKMKNMQINKTNSELTVDIAIRQGGDNSELSYLEQKLAKELMGACGNDQYIEGYAWKTQKVQNALLANNLIISPHNLAADKNLINYQDNNLIIGNRSNKLTIEPQPDTDMPSLVIGTKISDIYSNENIINISYDIDSLSLKSIKFTNVIIKGSDDSKKINHDALVITGSYPLDFKGETGISVSENCEIIAGKDHHGMHIATQIIGDLVNDGIIGDATTAIGLFISQPFEGTITNNNVIVGSEFAINSSIEVNDNNTLNIINNGTISGNLLFSNTSKNQPTDMGLVKLFNNSKINTQDHGISKNNTILDIYNHKSADIKTSKITANNIYNDGTITLTNELNYESFSNKGNLIFSGTILNLTKKFNNYLGTIKAKKLQSNDDYFSNNGNIYADEIEATKLINQENGFLVLENMQNEHIEIINNGILQVSGNLNLTNKIINNATLEVKNTLTLTEDYNNINSLIAHEIQGQNYNLTNKNATLFCDILNNINVIEGMVIVKQAIIGNNNISNLKINRNDSVNQTGNLKVNNITGLGHVIINGSVTVAKMSVKKITNKSLNLTIDTYSNQVKFSSINNTGKIVANKIAGCSKIENASGASIISDILQNILLCENKGELVVNKEVNNNVTVKGKLTSAQPITQSGMLNVGELFVNDIEINGNVIVNNDAYVNKLINNNIIQVYEKLTINANESINNKQLKARQLEIIGSLKNINAGYINIDGKEPVELSNEKFSNEGVAKIKKIKLVGDFTNNGTLTIESVSGNNNYKFTNEGDLYIKIVNLNDKFINNSFAKIEEARVPKSFINKGKLFITTLQGGGKGGTKASTFINQKDSTISVDDLQGIIVNNLGNFKLNRTISQGKLKFTGILTFTGDIEQQARTRCALDKIKIAAQEINYTLKEGAYLSFKEPIINDGINIINKEGNLSVATGSNFKSYTSNGGVLNIWLADNNINNLPLVTLEQAEFNTSKKQQSLIVLRAAAVNESMLFKSARVIRIIQAENILYNGKSINNADLPNLLAIQKIFSDQLKNKIKAESILLKIDSPEIVKEYNLVYITANLSWYDTKDINFLEEDTPYSLQLINELYKDSLGRNTYSLQSQIKNSINENKLPEEALYISEHVLEIVNSASSTLAKTKMEDLAKKDFINLLSQILPDNSLGVALTSASFSKSAFVDISKHLSLDRATGYQDASPNKSKAKKRRNYWGISTGSSYLDLSFWSSGSIARYSEKKDDQYATNRWNSQTFSFGIDDKLFNTTKIGLMFSYIKSTVINKSIKNTNNYNNELKTFLESIYINYQFTKFTLNFAGLHANTKHEHHNKAILSTKYISTYQTNILGFMSEFVYPYFFKSSKLEFVETVKFNSIFIPKYSISDFETRNAQRINVFSLGFATNFYYKLSINESTNINFLCSVLGYYSFSNTKNSFVKVNYFNKEFNIKQRSISSYDISLDLAANVSINNIININLDILAGIQKNSRFIGGKLSFNYNF